MASLTKLNPSLFFTARGHHLRRHAYCCSRLALRGPKGAIAAAAAGDSPPPPSSRADAENAGVAGFCIIEGPNTVQDFAAMELQEIRDNIMSRRNKIFLLMEEVRRLRIQLRIKNAEQGVEDDRDTPEYPSSIPFFPPLKTETLKLYYAICFGLIASIMLFGGLLAPSLELKLGLGGSSYKDFIQMLHLPLQLSQVDPIVASFSGGAVGVISALMVVEINNVKQQDYKRCKYCVGTGYLACARCSGTGTVLILPDTTSPEVPAGGGGGGGGGGGAAAAGARGKSKIRRTTTQRCPNCSGAAKVMCPTCLCTGMALASEHDPRIDPFD